MSTFSTFEYCITQTQTACQVSRDFSFNFRNKDSNKSWGKSFSCLDKTTRFSFSSCLISFIQMYPSSFSTENNSLQGHLIFTSRGAMINLRVVIRVRETRLNWF